MQIAIRSKSDVFYENFVVNYANNGTSQKKSGGKKVIKEKLKFTQFHLAKSFGKELISKNRSAFNSSD